MNGKPEKVRERLRSAWEAGDRLVVSTITLYEMRYGIAKSRKRSENLERLNAFISGRIEVLPFEEAHAESAGALRAALESNGEPIGPYDLLIAAQARVHGMTLVTANGRECERVQGLEIENWTA